MPVYEYLCDECGPFTDMRPMAECDAPQDCPRCESESPRVILTAPNFFVHALGQAQGPRHQRAQRATRRRPSTNTRRRMDRAAAAARPNPRGIVKQTRSGAKSFPTARPWMISH